MRSHEKDLVKDLSHLHSTNFSSMEAHGFKRKLKNVRNAHISLS